MADRKEYFYFIDSYVGSEQIAFVEKGTVTRNGWSSEYKTIQLTMTDAVRIRGSYLDDDLSTNAMTGTYSNIPSRFHEGVVNKAIAIGYKDPRHLEPEMASYFENEFFKVLKRAKKFVRSNYQSTGFIRPQDF